MHIVINQLNLSSLADGDIKIELEIIDAGLNKYNFEQSTIKGTIIPEILKMDLININKITADNYSFGMIIIGSLKNAKVIGVLEDIKGGSLSFEQVISEQALTNNYTISNINTSKLRDGEIKLKIKIIDNVENTSKIIEEIIYKDVILPEMTLDKDKIYSNSLEFTLQGLVIDRLNERIKVTYVRDDFEDDCVVQYSPSDTGGYNYVTCNIELKEDGETKLIITTKDSSDNFSEDVVYVNVNTSEVSLFFDNGLRVVTNDSSSILKITGTYKLSDSPDANSKFFAALKKQNVLRFKRYDLILNEEDNTFIINLDKDPTPGTQPTYPLTEGTYIVTVYLSDIYGNRVVRSQRIIIDSVSPKLEINNLETTNRNPELTGKVFDDLEKEVKVVINDITYDATVDGDNWTVQITDALPLGTHAVKVIAKDEATNQVEETKDGAVTINSVGGGGTRITPAAVPAPVEPTAEETPVEEPTPVENQPEENTNTGGETLTPVDTPIETPQLEETPIEETPTPSGLTGFAGFASSPGGVATIIGGALVVIGAIGYFFFLRPR